MIDRTTAQSLFIETQERARIREFAACAAPVAVTPAIRIDRHEGGGQALEFVEHPKGTPRDL
jgi:hypothetical protein